MSGLVQAQDLKTLADDLNSLNAISCEPEKDQNCVCKDNANQNYKVPDQRLLYKVTNADQIPELIKSELPIQEKEITVSSPFYISLWMDNDNIAFDAIKGGNDLGYTAGLQLEIGGVNKNGISYGGHIYTGLYTQRVLEVKTIDGKSELRNFDGNWKNVHLGLKLKEGEGIVYPGPKDTQMVKFNEDTVLSAFINNQKQGHWLLWDVKAGLAVMESQKSHKLKASGIQHSWHRLMNMVNYKYIPDSNDTSYSLYMRAVVGAQKVLLDGKSCSLSVSGNAGFNLANSAERRFIIAEIQSNLGLVAKKKDDGKLININLGSSTELGIIKQSTLKTGFNLNFHKFVITNQLMVPLDKGYAHGVASSYVDKDPIHRVGIIVPFHSKK